MKKKADVQDLDSQFTDENTTNEFEILNSSGSGIKSNNLFKERKTKKGQVLCILDVSKDTYEVFNNGTATYIGNYDYSSIFSHTEDFLGEQLIGKFISLPKSNFKVVDDGKIQCDVYEDGCMNCIDLHSEKYKKWKEGQSKLFKTTYVFRIKLGKISGIPTKQEIKDILKII